MPIRVLICEDSRFMQEVLRKILAADPELQVVGAAPTGREALNLAQTLRPDVVVLDVIMPDMDGFEILRHMVQRNLPTIIVSAVALPGSTVAVSAMEMGAAGCLCKPQEAAGTAQFSRQLVDSVKDAFRMTPENLSQQALRLSRRPQPMLAKTLVVIGASAGGPLLLREVLPRLPADLRAAVLVVQHLPASFTKQMAGELAGLSRLRVKEAQAGDVFVEGGALIAAGDQILKVEWVKNNWGAVNYSSIDSNSSHIRPWIDASMTTAAFLFGKRCLGVILSGMGSDGMEGMRKIREMGGRTIAQDEATSPVFGMPKAAIDAGVVDSVLPILEIPAAIVKYVEAMSKH